MGDSTGPVRDYHLPWARILSVAIVMTLVVSGLTVLTLSTRAEGESPNPVVTAVGSRELKIGTVQLTIGSTNPWQITLVDEWYIVYDVYSTLIGAGPDLKYEPDLAVKWRASSETLWEMWITRNAYWTNPAACSGGVCPRDRPVTGADVAFSYNFYVANIGSLGLFRDYITEINRAYVDPADPYHVFIEFNGPFAAALDTFAVMVIVPEYIWATRGIGDSNSAPVGSGPYMTRPGADLKIPPLYLDRNPNWHGKEVVGRQVFPNTVRFMSYTTSADMTLALTLGEIDLALGVSAAEWLDFLPGQPGIIRQSVAGGFIAEMAINVMTPDLRAMNPSRFNSGRSNPTLQYPEVRFAIHMATNRTKMIEKSLRGLGRVADTLVYPSSPFAYDYPDYTGGWPLTMPDVKTNPARFGQTIDREFPSGSAEALRLARQLLNDAGWTYDCAGNLNPLATPLCRVGGADRLEFRYATLSSDPFWKVATEGVVEDAAQVGIKLNLALYNTNQMNNQIWWSLDYDVWLWDWVFGLVADVSTGFLSVQTCGNLVDGTSNDNGFCLRDPTDGHWIYDDLYNQSIRTLTFTERKRVTDEMQRILYEYASYNLPFWRTEIYAMSEVGWKGWGDWRQTPGVPPDIGNPPLLGQTVYPADQRPPQVPELPPLTGARGSPIQFSVVATDPEGLPLRYRWDFDSGVDADGDGIYDNDNQASTATPTFTYAAAGTFGVTVRVSEDPASGGEWFTTRRTTVRIDEPVTGNPVVNGLSFSPIDPAVTDLQVTFAALASDPAGRTLTYRWNFGDGTPIVGPLTAPTVTHTYAAAGTYSIALEVRNSDGRLTTASTLVTVAPNASPSVAPLPAYVIQAGAVSSFVAFATDPNARDTLSFEWDFTSDGIVDATGNPVTFAYAVGAYTLTLRVRDSPGGHLVTLMTSVSAVPDRNTAPAINALALTPASPYNGQQVSIRANVSDPEGNGLNWSWDFNTDGVIDLQYDTSATTPGAFVEQTEAYAFAAAGNYKVTLSLVDIPRAGQSPKAKSTFTSVSVLSNTAPTLGAISFSPTAPAVDQIVTFSSSSLDANGDALDYTWDWGDGTRTTGRTPAFGGTITATHAYSDVGTQAVALVVSDGKGGTRTQATFVTVTAPVSISLGVTHPTSWSQVAVGQGIELTARATASGSALSGATVSWQAVGGTFSALSCLTDAAGSCRTTFTPDTSALGATVVVQGRATKTGLGPGLSEYSFDVVEAQPMTMAATSNRIEMMYYETATIDIRLDAGVGAVDGGLLTMTSSRGGNISAPQALGGGQYRFRWDAPRVTLQTFVALSLRARAGGFTDATGRIVILVDPNKTNPADPTPLFLLSEPERTELRPGQTINITVYAYVVEGYVVSGGTMTASVSATLGTVSRPVDRLNGVYTFTFTAATTITQPTGVLINVALSKFGYQRPTTRIGLIITP